MLTTSDTYGERTQVRITVDSPIPTRRQVGDNSNKRLTYANAPRYKFKQAFDMFLSWGPSIKGAFDENGGDGNRFGDRVLNHTHFRQSGVCVRRPRRLS